MELSKTVKTTVKAILEGSPEARDSDRLLILKVWGDQKPELRSKGFSFIEFSHAFLKKELASTESIRRIRQKIQEECVHLRGSKYKFKQTEAQDEMKQSVNLFAEELKAEPMCKEESNYLEKGRC